MLRQLAHQFAELRRERKLSRVELAAIAKVDRATIALIEAGGGTMASLSAAAAVLGHGPSPHSAALANKRRWLGIGTRTLAAAAGVSRPTLQAFESSGQGQVATFEAMCRALDEVPVLRPRENT